MHETDLRLLEEIDAYIRNQVLHAKEEREAFAAVVKQLLAERCAYGELKRKTLYHAKVGDIVQTKKNLQKLGIDPSRVDAILPLIRG